MLDHPARPPPPPSLVCSLVQDTWGMDRLGADVVVVGAGPAGSAAAAWAARSGYDVLVIDASDFPRDKPCGDGLTPRAVAELQRLGLGDRVRSRAPNRGVRAPRLGPGPPSPR